LHALTTPLVTDSLSALAPRWRHTLKFIHHHINQRHPNGCLFLEAYYKLTQADKLLQQALHFAEWDHVGPIAQSSIGVRVRF
jgi:hypothetical protein